MTRIELEQWDVKYIPSGNIVDTGTLGPCVGIIIHDKKKREAYAGHFVNAEMDGLENMIKDTISRFNKPSKLDVYVAGISVDYDESPEIREFGLRDRKFVFDLLKQYGFLDSRVHIRWSPQYCHAHLWLNVDTAENELEVIKNFGETVYVGDIKKATNPI